MCKSKYFKSTRSQNMSWCFKYELILTKGQAMIFSFYYNFYNRAISTFVQSTSGRPHTEAILTMPMFTWRALLKRCSGKTKASSILNSKRIKYVPEICNVVTTCLATCLPTARIFFFHQSPTTINFWSRTWNIH